jgi:hypothetical protein
MMIIIVITTSPPLLPRPPLARRVPASASINPFPSSLAVAEMTELRGCSAAAHDPDDRRVTPAGFGVVEITERPRVTASGEGCQARMPASRLG